MDAGSKDFHQDTLQRLYHQLDRLENRIDQLEGQMVVTNKWVEKLEVRNDRMEEIRLN